MIFSRVRWLRQAKSSRAMTAVCVIALLGVSGCTHAGDDSSRTGAGGAASTSSQPNADLLDSIQKDAAISKLVPAAIARKGSLAVGTDASYAPDEFIAADGKTITGFGPDYGKAIAQLMGLKVSFSNASFTSLIPGIGSKYDMAISSFNITQEREKKVTMTSYFASGMVMAVQKGNPKRVPADSLCGFKVAVQTGTTAEQWAREQSTGCTAAGKKSVGVLPYTLQTDATTNVAGGKADVALAESQVVNYSIKQTNGRLQRIGKTRDIVPCGVVTAKNDQGLSEAVRAATQKLIDDGSMKKILTAWDSQDVMISKSEINPTVK